MKKLIAILLLLCISSSLFSSSSGVRISPVKYEYEPYEKNEFPEWAMELRRADIVFFGSMAITLPVCMIAYNLASQVGMPTPEKSSTKMLQQVGGAAVLSLIVTGIDFALGLKDKK